MESLYPTLEFIEYVPETPKVVGDEVRWGRDDHHKPI